MNKFYQSYENIKSQLNEGSLSRLWQHAVNSDSGIITAFRSEEYDDDGNVVKSYTKKENMKNNKDLRAVLQRLGYGVIKVHGSYIENYDTDKAKEVKENAYFVFDKNNTGILKKDLKKLGQHYKQDSILFIPKGGKSAELIGTKKDEYSNKFAYPEYGQSVKYNKSGWGIENEFMTKKKNQPFSFTQADLNESPEPRSSLSRMGWAATARQVVEAMNDEDIRKRI